MPDRRFQFTIVSLVVSITYILSALVILYFGQFHEDAYILLQYARNLSEGLGIVFDQVSGPAEGATDFLWMIALSGLRYLGVDLAIAAAFLNGIGLFGVSYVIFAMRDRVDLVSLVGVVLVSMSGGTASSLGGFSALGYAGLYGVFTYALLKQKHATVSTLSCIIPLYRPDGLLLVAGGLSILLLGSGLRNFWRSAKVCLPILAVGSIYYCWRLNYFDQWLPLPLQVKSQTDRLFDGLEGNYEALKWYIPLLLPFGLLCIRSNGSRVKWRDILYIMTGPILLLIALAFAHQSQNTGFRFQFPIVVAGILLYIYCANQFEALFRLLTLLPLIAVPAAGMSLWGEVIYLTNGDYINSFPQMLRKAEFELDNIALTEAGRFPYWYNAERMTDLTGLNSVNALVHGAEFVLKQAEPKFIFIHHAGRFDTSSFESNVDYFMIDARRIKLNSYTGRNQVALAPAAALRYASERNYRAVFVRYRTSFSHVYFLSRDIDSKKFLEVLDQSIVGRLSYIASLHLQSKSQSDGRATH